MKQGDLVNLIDDNARWLSPGIIVKGPYGAVTIEKSRWDGKVIESRETKVVDVLVGTRVISKFPIENLKIVG